MKRAIGPVVMVMVFTVLLGGFFFVVERPLVPTPTKSTIKSTGVEYKMVMMPGKFEPKNLTIKLGDTITFVNQDTVGRWPASNIHPTHDIYPAFDPRKEIPPGESWSFTFGQTGTWKYHDHVFADLVGTITVEE